MLADLRSRGALVRLLPVLLIVTVAGAWSHDALAQPAAPVLRMNGQYIAAPEPGVDRTAWLTELGRYRERVRQGTAGAALDLSNYTRPDLAWAARMFACHFTFMVDRAFYDPLAGQYDLARFLDTGAREFGGYHAIVLWQAYPRIGIDQRNQFDLYRDMPGGLPGLRDLVRQAHSRGVKVFIDYNPWDTGTRRAGQPDEDALAEIVGAIEADGIFLDTMSAGSPKLRQAIDRARAGVIFEPEGTPAIEQLAICNASWAQCLNDPQPPGMLQLKWIEPRHIQHQIRRWDGSHRGEIETAFFNGSGMLIWENIFGVHNPWPAADRRLWRRAVAILNQFPQSFTSQQWDPFYPTRAQGLFAHRWPAQGATIFTLLNLGQPLKDVPLLEVRQGYKQNYYDLWNGQVAKTELVDDQVRLIGSLDRLGCLAVVDEAAVGPSFADFLSRQKEATAVLEQDHRNAASSVVEPVPVTKTAPVRRDRPPPGMVFVPGVAIRLRIEHRRRECGCYPDPGTPPERWNEFLWGAPHDGRLTHDIGPVEVTPFFIDEAQVTNAEYQRFVAAAKYRPHHPENFLKHWPDGKLPAELAEHPVVNVDLEDARAYARWAGKRLPTEPEWHLAAQGTDGRKWPWGTTFDASRCNTGGRGTLPVRSCPEGRSPYGCYHMSGNVWEWTESQRDDGHTRFAILRGGSYFQAAGSIWYTDGGPQPCDHHAKFLLMWPGLDRCATIGFRCVVDVEP